MKWKKRLETLHKTHSDQRIADIIGCDKTTIYRLRKGKSIACHYEIGDGIMRLLAEKELVN